MADWLKVNHSLVRSAKIRGLMRELRCKKHAALGLAVNWLCWVDEQTKDGQTGLLPDELDDEIGFRGCTDALISIGWAALGEDGCVYALEFGKHCGESARERAENARRVAKCKANKKRVTAEVTENRYQGNEKTLPEALPEKNRIIDIDTKGELSTTVDMEASACPSAPHAGFGEWLRVLGPAVPMLRRLNLDKPLPRVVEAEARKAAELVPMTAETVEMIRRFYEAEEVQGYRPDSLEWFFRDLPDVIQHASNFCRVDDRMRRKEAASARRRVMEREQCQNARTGASGAFIRSQDEADRNMELWREVCEEDEHA
jgi:hypothetical protein